MTFFSTASGLMIDKVLSTAIEYSTHKEALNKPTLAQRRPCGMEYAKVDCTNG
jgi:hypothetical protein